MPYMTESPVPLRDVAKPDVANLNKACTFLESYPWILFFIFVMLFLPAVLVQSQRKLLWHDELFTYYIAQAPNLPTLISQAQTLDLNPPLSYLFVRACFHLFHASATICRVPSMIGFLLCMGCVYSFLHRRFGALWGMAGVLLLATGDAYPYAFEARPYGLILGFIALAFVGWEKATDEQRGSPLGLFLLVFGGLGALLCHVFAAIAWIILIVAELVRAHKRHRLNWHILLAFLVPLTSVATYLPLLDNHSSGYFPIAFQPDTHKMMSYYFELFIQFELPLMWTTILALLFMEKGTFQVRENLAITTAQAVALGGLLLLPVILMICLMKTHGAFFTRYGIVANIAIAILIPVFSAWFTRGSRPTACVMTLILFLGSSLPVSIISLALHPDLLSVANSKPNACGACVLANRLAPELPFVDASGLTYIEMNSREDDGFLSRVYYLTDQTASLRYAHASIFEGMRSLKGVFPIHANVEEYSIFVRQHPSFLVLGTFDYPEDWLLRKVKADDAHLCLLATLSDSQFKDKQLWQVAFGNYADEKWIATCHSGV
jgi:hypothetical protein